MCQSNWRSSPEFSIQRICACSAREENPQAGRWGSNGFSVAVIETMTPTEVRMLRGIAITQRSRLDYQTHEAFDGASEAEVTGNARTAVHAAW
jgi:hypothetical protein